MPVRTLRILPGRAAFTARINVLYGLLIEPLRVWLRLPKQVHRMRCLGIKEMFMRILLTIGLLVTIEVTTFSPLQLLDMPLNMDRRAASQFGGSREK